MWLGNVLRPPGSPSVPVVRRNEQLCTTGKKYLQSEMEIQLFAGVWQPYLKCVRTRSVANVTTKADRKLPFSLHRFGKVI